MKKVYVLVAVSVAAFGAASAGSMSFASGECHQSYGDCSSIPDDSVPSTDDSVPPTDPTTTDGQDTTTTVDDTSTSAATTVPGEVTTSAAGEVTTSAAGEVTTSAAGSESSVDQLLPSSVSPTSVGSDGLLPNTGGGDIAIPLLLAGLAAGTGAATLLVRRRSNVG